MSCLPSRRSKPYRRGVSRASSAIVRTRRGQAVLQRVDQLIRCTSRNRRVRLYRVTATAPPPSPARRRRKSAIKAAPCHLTTPQPHHRSSLATPLHSENIPFICDVLLQTDAGRKPRHQHHHRCPGSGPVDRSAMLRYHYHPATPASAPPV
jgi:hypothetical protein